MVNAVVTPDELVDAAVNPGRDLEVPEPPVLVVAEDGRPLRDDDEDA